MDGNNLVGSLPAELAYLTKLVRLDLSANVLTGSIPTEMFLLTKLATLHIGSNQLISTVPSEIGQLTVLTELDYGENGTVYFVSSSSNLCYRHYYFILTLSPHQMLSVNGEFRFHRFHSK